MRVSIHAIVVEISPITLTESDHYGIIIRP